MKTIHQYIKSVSLVLCGSFLLSACDAFLDTEPYDFAAPETFYSNEKECTSALAGIYYTLVSEKVYGNFYSCMISNIDDLSYYQRNDGALAGQVYGNDHNPGNQHIWGAWRTLYEGINNANTLLENVDKANMSDEVKKRITGEAKFLRAYYHFLLVQGWYEVPVRKSSLKNINATSQEATPHAEALDWIIQEMKDCVDMVDDKNYDKSPSYVKKNTVMGVLARVCLWRAGFPTNGGQPFYAEAAKWAGEVVKSGKHRLNPDLYAIWKCMASDRYDTEFNESIWEAEFFGNREADGLGNYTDGRIGNVIGNIQLCTNTKGNGYAYGFYAPTLILWDLYNDNDKRRDVYIAPYKYNKNDKKEYWKYNPDKPKEQQIVQRSCGKFRREWETSSMKQKSFTPENYPLLRYADVLLMWSEGLLESGAPVAEAIKGINEVRKRAGIEELSADISTDELRQTVRDERARELCFESLRKYDLIRWGEYVSAIHDKLGAATQDRRWAAGNNYTGTKGYAERTTDKHRFLPIPTKELTVNTKMEQNIYWK